MKPYILFAILLCAAQAHGSALVQGVNGSNATTSVTVTFANPTAAGNAIICGLGSTNNNDAFSVMDTQGNTFTALGAPYTADLTHTIEMVGVFNITQNTADAITLTANAAGTHYLACQEWFEVTGVRGTAQTAFGTTANPAMPGFTVNPWDGVASFVLDTVASTASAGCPFTTGTPVTPTTSVVQGPCPLPAVPMQSYTGTAITGMGIEFEIGQNTGATAPSFTAAAGTWAMMSVGLADVGTYVANPNMLKGIRSDQFNYPTTYPPNAPWASMNAWFTRRFNSALNANPYTYPYASAVSFNVFQDASGRYPFQAWGCCITPALRYGWNYENMFLHWVSNTTRSYTNVPIGMDAFDVFDNASTQAGQIRNGALVYNGSTYYDASTVLFAGTCSGANCTLANSSYYLYLGYQEPFAEINFVFTTPMTGGAPVWQYCSAVTANACTTWSTLMLTSDGTTNLTANGQILFTPPANWVQNQVGTVNVTHSKYWVRLSVGTPSTPPAISTVKGNPWYTAGNNTTAWGWCWSCTAQHVNVGLGQHGELEFDPNPPAGQSAHFKYQARIVLPIAGNYANAYTLLNPAGCQALPSGGTSDCTIAGTSTAGLLTYPAGIIEDWKNFTTGGSWGAGATWSGIFFDQIFGGAPGTNNGNDTDLPCATSGPYAGPGCTNSTPPPSGMTGYNQYQGIGMSEVSKAFAAKSYLGNSIIGIDTRQPFHLTGNVGSYSPVLASWAMTNGGVYVVKEEGVASNGIDIPGGAVSGQPVTSWPCQVTGCWSSTADVFIPGSVNNPAPSGEGLFSVMNIARFSLAFPPSGSVIYHPYDTAQRTPMTTLAIYEILTSTQTNMFYLYNTTGMQVYNNMDFYYYWSPVTTTTTSAITGSNTTAPGASFTVADGTIFKSPGCQYSGQTGYYVMLGSPNIGGTPGTFDIFWATVSGNTVSPQAPGFAYFGAVTGTYPTGTTVSFAQCGHASTSKAPPVAQVAAYASYFPAMETDLGTPDTMNGWNGGARDLCTGTAQYCSGITISGNPNAATVCTGSFNAGTGTASWTCPPFYRRDFTKATVLFRPTQWGNTTLPSEIDTPSKPINLVDSTHMLTGPYYELYADGTCGPAITSITLRAAEGVVLMKQPCGSTTPIPLTITTSTLPGGTVGTVYTAVLQASGGTPPYTWSASGLPAGLSVSSGGTISGTPSAAGTASVIVAVTDSSARSAIRRMQ